MPSKKYKVMKDGKCLFESYVYSYANYHAERCGGYIIEESLT